MQAEVGGLVVVLGLLEGPADLLPEVAGAAGGRVEQFRPPFGAERLHLAAPRVLRRKDGGGGGQVAGQRRQLLHEGVEFLDLLDQVEVGLLALDLGRRADEVLELARRVERLQALQEPLEVFELLPLLLPLVGRDQFAAPAGQPGLDVLGGRHDLLGQVVGP